MTVVLAIAVMANVYGRIIFNWSGYDWFTRLDAVALALGSVAPLVPKWRKRVGVRGFVIVSYIWLMLATTLFGR